MRCAADVTRARYTNRGARGDAPLVRRKHPWAKGSGERKPHLPGHAEGGSRSGPAENAKSGEAFRRESFLRSWGGLAVSVQIKQRLTRTRVPSKTKLAPHLVPSRRNHLEYKSQKEPKP